MHKLVEYFNQFILGIAPRKLGLQQENEFQLSMRQLKEEIEEIEEAYQKGDLVAVIDGLIDLDYFHKGIVYKHGIPAPLYAQMFEAVHDCNMAKVKGVKETRAGFGDAADAIKPEGWVAPETVLAEIIQAYLK